MAVSSSPHRNPFGWKSLGTWKAGAPPSAAGTPPPRHLPTPQKNPVALVGAKIKRDNDYLSPVEVCSRGIHLCLPLKPPVLPSPLSMQRPPRLPGLEHTLRFCNRSVIFRGSQHVRGAGQKTNLRWPCATASERPYARSRDRNSLSPARGANHTTANTRLPTKERTADCIYLPQLQTNEARPLPPPRVPIFYAFCVMRTGDARAEHEQRYPFLIHPAKELAVPRSKLEVRLGDSVAQDSLGYAGFHHRLHQA